MDIVDKDSRPIRTIRPKTIPSLSALTVEKLASLVQPPMKPAAGAAGLSKHVTWVVSAEALDPRDWLRGGEFLLFCGWNLRSSRTAMRSYVRRMAEFGLSGIGFAIGFRFPRIPEAMLEEAEVQQLPLLEVPYELGFEDVARAAAEVLLKDGLSPLAATLNRHFELANGLISGATCIDDLLSMISSHLQCAAIVQDSNRRTIASRHELPRSPLPEHRIELPIGPDQNSSRLILLRYRPGLTQAEHLLLNEFRLAIGLEFARQNAVQQSRQHLQDNFVRELAIGRLDAPEIRSRLATFGFNPHGTYRAVTVRIREGSSYLPTIVNRALHRLATRCISAYSEGMLSALIEISKKDEHVRIGAVIVEEAPAATVGVGSAVTADQLGQTLNQANYLARSNRVGVVTTEEVGALELIMGVEHSTLAAYVERMLQRVGDEVVLFSVEVLLDSGFSWSDASRQLGIHRHTLRYRVDKFIEITGVNILDPKERLDVWIALKGRHMTRTGFERQAICNA